MLFPIIDFAFRNSAIIKTSFASSLSIPNNHTIFHISQKYLHSWFSLSNFEKNWTDHGYLFLMSNSRKPCLKWYLGTSIQEWASIFIILRYIIFHIWHDTVNIQTVLQAPMSIYRREYYIFHVYFKNQS